MGAVKGFWQHTNGKIYAIKSDTFGKIIGGVGPLDPDDLHDLDDYDYKPAIKPVHSCLHIRVHIGRNRRPGKSDASKSRLLTNALFSTSMKSSVMSSIPGKKNKEAGEIVKISSRTN